MPPKALWTRDTYIELLAYLSFRTSGPKTPLKNDADVEAKVKNGVKNLRIDLDDRYTEDQIRQKLRFEFREVNSDAYNNFWKVFHHGPVELHLDRTLQQAVEEKARQLLLKNPLPERTRRPPDKNDDYSARTPEQSRSKSDARVSSIKRKRKRATPRSASLTTEDLPSKVSFLTILFKGFAFRAVANCEMRRERRVEINAR